jgi:hypothetical protein
MLPCRLKARIIAAEARRIDRAAVYLALQATNPAYAEVYAGREPRRMDRRGRLLKRL